MEVEVEVGGEVGDGLLFCAALGAEVGDTPAEVDKVEPEFLAWFWMRAEPGFEIIIGGLPVLPFDSSLVDGATGGAVVVNVERL